MSHGVARVGYGWRGEGCGAGDWTESRWLEMTNFTVGGVHAARSRKPRGREIGQGLVMRSSRLRAALVAGAWAKWSSATACAVSPCTPKASGNYTETWTQQTSAGPIQRSWIVHIPPGYDGRKTFSAILNFHGNTSTASGQESWSKMSEKANAAGFLVVYPEGYNKSWDVGRDCCGDALAKNIDDVGFARHIVQHLKENYCVDPDRIYVTGMSAGAGMAAKLACQAADLFAGAAVVSGAFISPPCNPVRPIAVQQFWGTSDPFVSSTDAYNTRDTYVAVDHCNTTPTRTYTNNKATCDTYTGCDNGVRVAFCKIEGMGHC